MGNMTAIHAIPALVNQHNNMLLWLQSQIRGCKTSLQSCLVKLQALTHRIFPS